MCCVFRVGQFNLFFCFLRKKQNKPYNSMSMLLKFNFNFRIKFNFNSIILSDCCFSMISDVRCFLEINLMSFSDFRDVLKHGFRDELIVAHPSTF